MYCQMYCLGLPAVRQVHCPELPAVPPSALPAWACVWSVLPLYFLCSAANAALFLMLERCTAPCVYCLQHERGVINDTDLTADDLKKLVAQYKEVRVLPQDTACSTYPVPCAPN